MKGQPTMAPLVQTLFAGSARTLHFVVSRQPFDFNGYDSFSLSSRFFLPTIEQPEPSPRFRASYSVRCRSGTSDLHPIWSSHLENLVESTYSGETTAIRHRLACRTAHLHIHRVQPVNQPQKSSATDFK